MINRTASKENFLKWASTPEFAKLVKQRGQLPWLMIAVGVLTLIMGLIFSEDIGVIGLFTILIGWVRRHLAKKKQPDIFANLSNYEILPCFIVIANSQALATPNSKAPAAVVGGFSPETPGYIEALAHVAEHIGGTYGSDQSAVSAELTEACALINDDTYREGRQRPVPAQNTSGHQLFFFDSILESSYFESKKIDAPFVFLAVPPESGSAFHVPFELVVIDDDSEASHNANIINHEMPEENGYIPLAEVITLPLVEQHIETHFGLSPTVFHELVSEIIHIDLHIVPSTGERPWQTIVTSGMGDLAMTTPPETSSFNRAELLLRLSPEWPLDENSISNETHYWPLHLLKTLARLPHQLNTWFGSGHTIPLGEGTLPSGFVGIILGPPHWAPESFSSTQLPDGSPLHFLSVIPLYQSEMDFKLTQGADALFEKLWNGGVWDLIQPGRPPVC